MMRNTALLILGFKRPELIEKLLATLLREVSCPVVVSVDALKYPDDTVTSHFHRLHALHPTVEWQFRKENLGVARHIVTAITEIFEKFDNCIIIEDDVFVTSSSVIALEQLLENRFPSNVLTAGLFGFVPSLGSLDRVIRNNWRETKYFSAWGWAIQREDWPGFTLDLAKNYLNSLDEIIEVKVGPKKLPIWRRRFMKVASQPKSTWDFQMFLFGLINDKVHLLPKIRVAENLGFADERATNTRTRRPSWYIGKATNSTPCLPVTSSNSIIVKSLEFIDSATWVSDNPQIQKLRHRRKYNGRSTV